MTQTVELKPLNERWELLKSRTKLPFPWEVFARQHQAEWQVDNCRRRFERKALRTIAILVRGEELHAAYTRDISQQGVGLFVPVNLLPNERIWVELAGRRLLPLRVVRCKYVSVDCYLCAGEFAGGEAGD